jgi:hypothetical protein
MTKCYNEDCDRFDRDELNHCNKHSDCEFCGNLKPEKSGNEQVSEGKNIPGCHYTNR